MPQLMSRSTLWGGGVVWPRSNLDITARADRHNSVPAPGFDFHPFQINPRCPSPRDALNLCILTANLKCYVRWERLSYFLL